MIQRHFRPALLPVILVGCCLAAQTPVKSQPQARTASSKPALSDAELERAIRERFARSKSGADKFTVRVQGGVATIEGQTDVVQRKAAATRMAKAAGARKVVNKIQVNPESSAAASRNLAQGRRRAQVKRSETER